MKAELYLCCYDIEDDKTRGQVYRTFQQYQSGGQFSAYECYLTIKQKDKLEEELNEIIDQNDTLKFQVLRNTSGVICLGQAKKSLDPSFLYIG